MYGVYPSGVAEFRGYATEPVGAKIVANDNGLLHRY